MAQESTTPRYEDLSAPERAALDAWNRVSADTTGMLYAVRAALTVAGCSRCQQHGIPARLAECGPACHEAHTYIAPCAKTVITGTKEN